MMSNRRVLEILEERGDKLNVPREVNHWIYFKNEEDRGAFERAVNVQNFTTIDSGFDQNYGEYAYKLVVAKTENVDVGDIDSYSSLLLALAEQFNGDYDGWECPMILNDDNAEDN